MIVDNEVFSCVNCKLLQPQNAFCYQCVKSGYLYTLEKYNGYSSQHCPTCDVYYSNQIICPFCKEPNKICFAVCASEQVQKTYKRFAPRGCNHCGRIVWNQEPCCLGGTFLIRNMSCRVL